MRKILIPVAVIASVLLVTIVGYMIILRIGFVDALYMTVITVSTVGYGEVATMDEVAKIWSVGVIVVNLVMLG